MRAFVEQRCALRSCSLELEDNEVAVWSVRREVWNASRLPSTIVRRQLPTDSYDGEHGVLVGLWRASALAPGTSNSNYLHRGKRALLSPLSPPLRTRTRAVQIVFREYSYSMSEYTFGSRAPESRARKLDDSRRLLLAFSTGASDVSVRVLRAAFACYALPDAEARWALLHTMGESHQRSALSPPTQLLLIALPAAAALLGGLILGLQCVLIGVSPWPDNSMLV